MQHSKIAVLLKNLEAGEFRLLAKYLKSPFFNYSTAIIGLYDYLRKFYPEFEGEALHRKKVFRKLFPGEEYNDKKMRNLLHEFYNHLEQFLIQLHIRSEDFTAKKLLVEALAKRGSYDTFIDKHRDLREEVSRRPYRNLETFAELLSLEEQYYFHPATNKLDQGEKSLTAILENLDNYFIASKLRLANEVATRRRVVKQEIEMRFTEEVLQELKGRKDVPVLLQLQALNYQLNRSSEEPLYRELKEIFLEKYEHLSFADQQSLLFQLLNYAVRRGNQGELSFLAEAFDFYWFGLEKKLLFEYGKLTDSTYTNIAFLGVKLGKLDKVEAFIAEHTQYLDETVREDARMLALANLLYHRKDYEELDRTIGNTRFVNAYYQLRVRVILLRALYESFLADDSLYDLVQSKLEAFEKFLRRNDRISSMQARNHLDFVRFLKQVMKLKQVMTNKAEKEALREKIKSYSNLPGKNWLLDQV